MKILDLCIAGVTGPLVSTSGIMAVFVSLPCHVADGSEIDIGSEVLQPDRMELILMSM